MSFLDLFALSSKKNCKVAEVLIWTEGTHRWDFESLFLGENGTGTAAWAAAAAMPCWNRFSMSVSGHIPFKFENDTFVWSINAEKEFTVANISSAVNNSKPFGWDSILIRWLKAMWDLNLPPKIKLFALRFLIDRLPTKDELLKRGLSSISNPNCDFCGNVLESTSHLFFLCQEAREIWNHIFGWLGIKEEINFEEFLSFGDLQDKVKNRKRITLINFVWFATIWSLWLMRNAIIFKEEGFCFDVICTNIVFLAWRWLCVGYPKFRPSYYEWFKLPLSDYVNL
ncbi:uncharacterized protein LOC131614382 [Vicia villosa]|uniref:uncharacterized protein LOC131614382 n=1 Tax=Vicia villosa TaxID=3911 RepID=UPI00273BA305|nr:uncharacterized protein LOC131614382 [Vicia villosa]